MPLSAIAFDLDNTLVESVSTDEEVLEIVRRHGASGSDASLMELITGCTSDWDIVRACLSPASTMAAYREILQANASVAAGARCHPELRAVLEALAARYPLFLASGRDPASAGLILDSLEILHCFRDIAAAGPHSYAKPDARVLTGMLARHRLLPEETLCIGDRPDDREMARRAGAEFIGAAIFVHRLPADVPVIRSLGELLPAINAIAERRSATTVIRFA
jgi:HAD superfamily hydrolase (TIGR01549 family)